MWANSNLSLYIFDPKLLSHVPDLEVFFVEVSQLQMSRKTQSIVISDES